jgi:hypothetical protein
MRSETKNIGDFQFFLKNLSEVLFRGGRLFYGWIAALSLLLLIGIIGYIFQMQAGHAVTNMREQVSWGFYISNFWLPPPFCLSFRHIFTILKQ